MNGPEAVTYSADGLLGIISMSDGRGNRLNPQSLEALGNSLENALADPDVKLILLRSKEDAFCSGMDLDMLAGSLSGEGTEPATGPGSNASGEDTENEDSDLQNSGFSLTKAVTGYHQKVTAWRQRSYESQIAKAKSRNAPGSGASDRSQGVEQYSDLLLRISSCSKPVIALVEGPVTAGGVGLAAACDIVIAAEQASWELSEILFGLVPYNVLPFVFGLRMSPQRFRYLVLSARRLPAAEAREFGLVDEVFPEDKLEKGLKSLLKTMMRAEPSALANAKSFFTSMVDSSFTEQRDLAQQELLERMKNPSVRQGLEAFSAGDIPGWFMRYKPTAPLTRGLKDTPASE